MIAIGMYCYYFIMLCAYGMVLAARRGVATTTNHTNGNGQQKQIVDPRMAAAAAVSSGGVVWWTNQQTSAADTIYNTHPYIRVRRREKERRRRKTKIFSKWMFCYCFCYLHFVRRWILACTHTGSLTPLQLLLGSLVAILCTHSTHTSALTAMLFVFQANFPLISQSDATAFIAIRRTGCLAHDCTSFGA